MLLSGSTGIYLEATWLPGLGKVIKQAFLVGSILERGTKFLCTEFPPGSGGRQACQSLGSGRRERGEGWLAKNSQGGAGLRSLF